MLLRRLAGVVIVSLAVGTPATAASDRRLIDAVRARSSEAARALIAGGANPNATEADGATALHWAAHWNDLETVNALIKAGANVNARNDLGATPLWVASVHGDGAMVETLLRAGADSKVGLPSGETPLMTAARAGALGAVKALAAHGADVNAAEDVRNQTALMWAVAQHHHDIVRLLVESGADVHARTRVRPTLVYVGGRQSSLLVDPGLLPLEAEGGFTPLLFAARTGNVASARILLAAGAKVNDTAPTGVSALVIAAFSGHTELASLLLDQGADVNADGAGYTALHAAIMRYDFALVKILLDRGAHPNAVIRKSTAARRTSGDWAIEAGWIGGTPFWLAANLHQADVMRQLAARGGDPRYVTPAQQFRCTFASRPGDCPYTEAGRSTALIVAIWGSGSKEYVPNPVTEAAASPQQEIAMLALEFGVDINAADEDGDTALHYAARQRDEAMVQFLVDRGASLSVTNAQGQTPIAFTLAGPPACSRPEACYSRGDTGERMAALLRKLGAKE